MDMKTNLLIWYWNAAWWRGFISLCLGWLLRGSVKLRKSTNKPSFRLSSATTITFSSSRETKSEIWASSMGIYLKKWPSIGKYFRLFDWLQRRQQRQGGCFWNFCLEKSPKIWVLQNSKKCSTNKIWNSTLKVFFLWKIQTISDLLLTFSRQSGWEN